MGLFDEFKEDEYYHVFSRSNNSEMLFHSPENRNFFLQKVQIYLSPYFEIHGYALMGNHYHILVRVKSMEEVIDAIGLVEMGERTVAMKLLHEAYNNKGLLFKTSPLSKISPPKLNNFLIHQM